MYRIQASIAAGGFVLAAFAIAFAFQLVTSAPADAATLTGCITKGGALKNVAEGLVPLKPCGPNDTEVTWDEHEAVSTCPCDYLATKTWAAWFDPKCEDFSDFELESLVLSASQPDFTSIPFVEATTFDFGGDPEHFCSIESPQNTQHEAESPTPSQFEDCLADINELAIALGLVDGCALP